MSKQRFTVWRPDYGQEREDGREIDAYSPEDAAEEWAQRADSESADYLIPVAIGALGASGGRFRPVSAADLPTVYTRRHDAT